jgi:hypothetical protein
MIYCYLSYYTFSELEVHFGYKCKNKFSLPKIFLLIIQNSSLLFSFIAIFKMIFC